MYEISHVRVGLKTNYAYDNLDIFKPVIKIGNNTSKINSNKTFLKHQVHRISRLLSNVKWCICFLN